MIYIASDHAGLILKQTIIEHLKQNSIPCTDLGTYSPKRVDYTDYAQRVCKKVIVGEEKGILICGTGIGMSMVANRFKGIRAAVCTNEYMIKMAVRHNNANILCLGSRVIGDEIAKGIVSIFLSEKFEEGRHKKRVMKFDKDKVNR